MGAGSSTDEMPYSVEDHVVINNNFSLERALAGLGTPKLVYIGIVKCLSELETVPAITKRTIGKLIVKHCGNEGQADDPTLYVTLRQILQATITKLDTESQETWENAEIVIYDQEGNDFCIRSGDAENKFVVQLDEKDEINIMCTHRKKHGVLSWLKSLPKVGSSKPEAIESNVDSATTVENPESKAQ